MSFSPETMQISLVEKLKSRFGGDFKTNEPMSDHTTFGIGGPASGYVRVTNEADFVDAVNICVASGQEYFILGGGSNLLVSDKGYCGVIIHTLLEHFEQEGDEINVGSGYDLEDLIEKLCTMGLGGVEMLAGIKGSVGGAVYGNAGAYGGAISDCLVSARIFRPGSEARVEYKNYFEFAYRDSILKRTKEIVIDARFRLKRRTPESLLQKRHEILNMRAERHPKTDCSAGCFFKNIEKPDEKYGKLAAGYLLDQVGAKQARVGNAGVHVNHANILVNLGGATADDVRRLSLELKTRVKEKFGYILEEEITLLGDFS
jgi:UDP-N-acetylmuramate dehydrogenase